MKRYDPLIDDVVELTIKNSFISTPFLQRHFKIDYYRAQRILKQLTSLGYIEPGNEFTSRKVLKHKYIQ